MLSTAAYCSEKSDPKKAESLQPWLRQREKPDPRQDIYDSGLTLKGCPSIEPFAAVLLHRGQPHFRQKQNFLIFRRIAITRF